MKEIGRNDPCHCGSGKKYKNCHMGKSASVAGSNKTLMYLTVFAVIIAIAAFSIYYSWDETPSTNGRSNSNRSFTPAPAGEAPPGEVWSAEHGHWHDI
jgi:hypothetical protein